MLDCCAPLSIVQTRGITFTEFACLARCNGLVVSSKRYQAFKKYHAEFIQDIKSVCASDDHHVVIAFDRVSLNQTGTGHYSPIGAYHPGKNLVLVLDVARFKVFLSFRPCLCTLVSFFCSTPLIGHL
jgi:glutathione gamma-glutamylcysteinyltransferase